MRRLRILSFRLPHTGDTVMRPCLALLLPFCLTFAACKREAPPATTPPAQPPVTTPTPTPAPAYTQGYAVELAPGQGEAELRAAADAVFDRVVSVERLFPDVDPADDPEGLSRIWRVRVADAPRDDARPWDQAYALHEKGGFTRVEPDTEDTLEQARTRNMAAAGCVGDGVPAPTNPSWSLAPDQMNVIAARLLQPPTPDGRQLGEGIRICHPDTGWTDHVDLDAARIDRAHTLNLMEGGTDARDPMNYSGRFDNPGHGTKTGSVLVSAGGFDANGDTTPPGRIDGLAPKATLVPIRTFNSVIRVLDSNTARAVRHAAVAQCDVLSMSLGGRAFFGLERAINDAVKRGTIVVNAAGNCVGIVVAPATYDNAIAVGATNAQDKPWKGSSHGRAVDISAPGEDVYVANAVASGTGTEAAPGDGTSFATAAVAGAAADWLAFHGKARIDAARGSLTRRDLFVQLLQASARVPNGFDKTRYGAGVLDLEALLQRPLGAPRTQLRPPPRDDTLNLIARTLDRDPAQVRDGLRRMLGQPADLDAELARFGPELTALAMRDADAFNRALDPPAPGALAAPGAAIAPQASRTLAQRMRTAP